MTTLSDAAGGERFPSLPVTLAYVRACAGDPAHWEARWHEVAGELAASGDGEYPAEAGEPEVPCPYAGLAAFQMSDAGRFFGRDALVADLADRLCERRFLAVFGASGSGKSSVLRAGLAGRAVAGQLSGGAGQPVLLLTPGPHPLEECAVQLAAFAGDSAPVLRAELAARAESLHLRIRQALAGHPADRELLLVVDQFEEVFTQCRDEPERARFIEALLLAASGPTSRTRVVIGVRADFYGHCGEYAGLVEAINAGQVLVGPMTPDELTAAIVRPAAGAGLTVETTLVGRLVCDASGQPAALPLVSHALAETWRRRRGCALTLAGYEASGGMQQAIARTAETWYGGLTAGQRDAARQVFLRLVTVEEGTQPAKRRVPSQELDGGDPDTAAVLEKLAAARLLTLDRDSVQIAHEALVRHWPRLAGWIDEDRDGLRTRHQLAQAAAAWESLDRDPSGLYRGTPLARAQSWADRSSGTLGARERDFLSASLAAQHAGQVAARRRTRRSRQLVALLATLLVLAPAAVIYASRAHEAMVRERKSAAAQGALGQAAALRATNPALSTQLTLAAYRLDSSEQARNAVLNTFADPYDSHLVATGTTARAAAYSPVRSLLAVASADETELWDVGAGHQPHQLTVIRGDVTAVAFSPNGRLLVTGSATGTIRVWDLTNPHNLAELIAFTKHTSRVTAVTISPDGGVLATASDDGTAMLWNLTDPRNLTDPSNPTPLATLTAGPAVPYSSAAPPAGLPPAGFTSVAFSHDSRTLAAASKDGTVRLWNLNLTDPRHPTSPLATLTAKDPELYSADSPPIGRRPAGFTSVAFSPDGRLLAAGSADRTTRLWDPTAPHRPQLATLNEHSGTVMSVVFSPDRRRLATTSNDHTTEVWDYTDAPHPRWLYTLTGHTDSVMYSAFSQDGQNLITVSYDGTIRRAALPTSAVPDTDPEWVAKRICELAPAPITPAQWDRYLWGVPYRPPCA